MKKVLVILNFIALLLLVVTSEASPILKFKFMGLSSELQSNVIARLQLKQNEIISYSDAEINNFYNQSPSEIAKALEPYGYFKAKVSAPRITHNKNKWEGAYNVVLGPAVQIVAIDLQILGPGATNSAFMKKLADFPLKKGEVFQADKYNAAKQFLFDLAATNGYVAAYLAHKEVQIDLENNIAKIRLDFATGPQYYFGETTFVAPYFSQKFLRRFLPYKQNEVYSSTKISQLHEALTNSNFFQEITVNPKIGKNNLYQVPVEVTVVPRKARQYNFGVGYGTDTGARASVGLELRHLTPEGQHFKSLLQVSQVQNDLELHYLIPGAHPTTDLYDFNAAGETLSLKNGKSLAGQIGAGYITVLKGWNQTVKLSLHHEHYQLTDQPYQSSTLLIPSINWLHNRSDDPISPNKGHSINITVQGASKYLIASTNFLQVQGNIKYLNTIFWQMQVVLRAAFGYTEINDINNLPLSLQFYTGGAQSVRGFGYNSIGPGRNLAVGSVELRRRVYGDWYLAAFADAGNATNNVLAKPNESVGGGIVWRTGIGVLELTYAKAITLPGTPGRIQFVMGPEL